MWPKEGVVEMEDGRRIRLIDMYRHDIYCNLMEGSPFRQMNFERIRNLESRGRDLMNWAVLGKPPAILPTRIWKRRDQVWADLDWYQFRELPSAPAPETRRIYEEWMPGVGTVALFRSDAIKNDPEDGDISHLLVIWFQREPVEMIESEPLESMKKLPWDALATSWSI